MAEVAENTAPPPIGTDIDVKVPTQTLQEPANITTHTSSRADSSASSFKSTASQQLESQQTPASSAKTTEEAEKTAEEDEFKIPTDGPLKVPIPTPGPQQKPPPPATLTGDQESKYAQVLARVSTWTTIPTSTAKKAPQAPLEDHERMWLTRECLLRYLRATKWNVANALIRLQSTLSWRREYGADKFTYDYISPENETGKQVILGYDNDARPCLYLNPAKQNTKMSDRQIHHLCFMLDRTIDMMPPGQENSALIINFKGASSGNVPTVSQARQVLNILQGHNPERLGKALISELPWYVTTFFKIISPFIDPVTKSKMHFNEDLNKYIPSATLWDHHDGDLNFEYDHSVYWPALERETRRRKEVWRTRWVEGGMMIGEYEEFLKGGMHCSLREEIEAAGFVGGLDSGVTSAEVGMDKLAVK